jgi:A/G-specific adenine glycosylase
VHRITEPGHIRPTEGVPYPPARLRRLLLGWYATAARDLPWRWTDDAYRIWVSEVMLQQTRVEVVRGYYERFLADFPTIEALAAAPLDRVLARWSGLGYYQRARSLHAAAVECRDRYGGQVPRRAEQFGSLKGVGPYTTAAVLSIAYGVPLAVVDGNVIRVLARLAALPGHRKSTELKTVVTELAGILLAPRRAGDFNQALMELGATVCTPANPSCDRCPLRSLCAARATGEPVRWPQPAPRQPVRLVHWHAAVVRRRGRILLVRRAADRGRFRGMWELPWGADRFEGIAGRYGIELTSRAVVGSVRHQVMNERMTVTVHKAALAGRAPSPQFAWVAESELRDRPLASVWSKVLRVL